MGFQRKDFDDNDKANPAFRSFEKDSCMIIFHKTLVRFGVSGLLTQPSAILGCKDTLPHRVFILKVR